MSKISRLENKENSRMSLPIERIKKIRPLHDRVLVEVKSETENKTAGGILLPEQTKERPQMGTVIATGPGKANAQGVVQPVQVRAGEQIFFGKYAGTEVGENFIILREDEIFGVV